MISQTFTPTDGYSEKENKQIPQPPVKVAGENYYIGLSTYRLVAFAVGGRELGYCKHLARLLAGGGVDIE